MWCSGDFQSTRKAANGANGTDGTDGADGADGADRRRPAPTAAGGESRHANIPHTHSLIIPKTKTREPARKMLCVGIIVIVVVFVVVVVAVVGGGGGGGGGNGCSATAAASTTAVTGFVVRLLLIFGTTENPRVRKSGVMNGGVRSSVLSGELW